MKRLNSIVAAGLILCAMNAAHAHEAATLVVSTGLSDFSIAVDHDGTLNVNCVERCTKKINFHAKISGIPMGIIQQTDNLTSATILLSTGSHYHVVVLYFTDQGVNKIFDKYSKKLPTLGVDNNANPTIQILIDDNDKSCTTTDAHYLNQVWVENDNRFKLKSR